MGKKVSVIIPAYQEENFIENTLKSYRLQNYPAEIIVVVNNSTDKTKKIADLYADKVFNFDYKIGISRARNEGVKMASGDIFIFSDADSQIELGGIKKIVEEFNENNIVGTLSGRGDKGTLRERIFFFFKNLASLLGLHRGGVSGIIFCSKETFSKTGGFSSDKEPAEQRDFFIKAQKAGAKYRFITNCFAYTSMRRYEQKGYIKTIIFWIKWRVLSLFKKDKKLVKNYYKIKK